MAVANTQYGGYNFSFTKPVPERFYCNICTKVLRNPQLTFCCGQHFCESCLKHWSKKQKTTCPHCREENFNHVLNKALKREISDLEIRCTKQGLGCQWVGELSSLQTHLDSDKGCRYVEVQCSNNCGAKTMKRNKLKAHLEQQCPLRKIQCQYCHYEDTYQTITSKHYDECPHYPLPCPNWCGTGGIRRADMDKHRSRCQLEPVECPFREAGCKVNVVRKEFDSHMSGNQQTHLLLLLAAYQETKREVDESRKKLDENQKELDDSRTKLHNTRLKLLQLEESQHKQTTLRNIGDEVTFCMYDYSLYKSTDKVWYSPPFYYGEGYKLCLAVYANGKGTGAGTHVSVELLQLYQLQQPIQPIQPSYYSDHYARGYGQHNMYKQQHISIQMKIQKAEARRRAISHSESISYGCFSQVSEREGFRVLTSCYTHNNYMSKDQFIDHQSTEEVMVLNDTITLTVSLL